MKFLLDTHILLWTTTFSKHLSEAVRSLLADVNNELFFSDVSLWEVAIKNGLGRSDFQVNARIWRRELLSHDYRELAITSEHIVSIDGLPLLHKDPFDRLLVTQAMIEGVTLLTDDERLAQYPGPVQKI